MDGDWMYAAIGKKPWYLLAYNFTTRENRVLATAPIIGDYKTIEFNLVEGGGVSGYIREADFVDGITEFDPWSSTSGSRTVISMRAPAISRLGARSRPCAVAISSTFSPGRTSSTGPRTGCRHLTPPSFDHSGGTADRMAMSRVRTAGAVKATGTSSYQVSAYHASTACLTEVNDHVIFGATHGYAEHTFFNLATKQRMGAGSSGISGYTWA